jgi:hypothetical protein
MLTIVPRDTVLCVVPRMRLVGSEFRKALLLPAKLGPFPPLRRIVSGPGPLTQVIGHRQVANAEL